MLSRRPAQEDSDPTATEGGNQSRAVAAAAGAREQTPARARLSSIPGRMSPKNASGPRASKRSFFRARPSKQYQSNAYLCSLKQGSQNGHADQATPRKQLIRKAVTALSERTPRPTPSERPAHCNAVGSVLQQRWPIEHHAD